MLEGCGGAKFGRPCAAGLLHKHGIILTPVQFSGSQKFESAPPPQLNFLASFDGLYWPTCRAGFSARQILINTLHWPPNWIWFIYITKKGWGPGPSTCGSVSTCTLFPMKFWEWNPWGSWRCGRGTPLGTPSRLATIKILLKNFRWVWERGREDTHRETPQNSNLQQIYRTIARKRNSWVTKSINFTE